MNLSSLPPEVCELIFSAVVWDDFSSECVESLSNASACIDRVHERNRQLRALRPTAKFVDCIVNRLAFKYVHITSKDWADELIDAASRLCIPGTAVRHLFLGDKLGRFHRDNAPDYSWVTAESGKIWIESGTLSRLLSIMPHIVSLHIHLPAIHSQIFTSTVLEGHVAPLASLCSIRCLSLYDDVNNSHCYAPVRSAPGARQSLSAFPNLRYLIVSESEGVRNLDRLIGLSSSPHVDRKSYAPQLQKIVLEKWCPMEIGFILYNIAMEIPWTDLRMTRRVPRRMSMENIRTIIGKIGPTLTSLRLEFYYHFADDLIQTNAHLCTTIRDHCQNLEYLTLSFPPSDKVDDTPRASVCHQLFRAPLISSTPDVGRPGMPNLKKAEIIGYHNYCEGSSRDMVIEASEDVWESQNQLWWKTPSDGEDTMDPECSHTNVQIHENFVVFQADYPNCRPVDEETGSDQSIGINPVVGLI